MATKLNGRAVVRETTATYQGRPIIIKIEGRLLWLREKGRRRWWCRPIESVFGQAVLSETAAARANKKPRRVSRGLLTM